MPIIKKGERQILKPGMIIDVVMNSLNAAIYRVENITTDNPPVLTLSLIDETGNVSQGSYVIDQDEIFFGRATQAELQVTIRISGKHFAIQREGGQFVYAHLGINPAILSANLQVRDVERIQALIIEMLCTENLIRHTRHLEEPSDLTSLSSQVKGGRSENDLESYIVLIRAYSYLKLQDKPEQQNILFRVSKILATLEEERVVLRAIQENPVNKKFFENIYANPSILCPFQKELDSLVGKKILKLKQTGQVFVESGLPRHQAFGAVSVFNSNEGVHYYHLTFDAGLGTRIVGPDRAMVVYGQSFRQSSEAAIRKFFYINYLRKLCGGDFDNQFHSFLQDEFDNHLEDTPQRKGNCTTRSPRTLLKYILLQKLGENVGRQLFEDIYNFIYAHKTHTFESIIQDLKNMVTVVASVSLQDTQEIPLPNPQSMFVHAKTDFFQGQQFNLGLQRYATFGNSINNDRMDVDISAPGLRCSR